MFCFVLKSTNKNEMIKAYINISINAVWSYWGIVTFYVPMSLVLGNTGSKQVLPNFTSPSGKETAVQTKI